MRPIHVSRFGQSAGVRGFLFCLVLWMLLPGSVARGQNSSDDSNGARFWINWGSGFGFGAPNVDQIPGEDTPDLLQLSNILGASYQKGKHLFSARRAKAIRLESVAFFFPTGDITTVEDIAILYGRATQKRGSVASIAAGIGYVQTEIVETKFFVAPESATKKSTVGLALEAQLFGRIGGIFGLGFYGFANINSQNTFGGISFSIQGGKLR